MKFEFKELSLKNLILIEHEVYEDDRGFFTETFRENAFKEGGVPGRYVQESHSRSTKGVLRGMHYQLDPCAQGKLLRCGRGEIFDAVIDLRDGSPTYGQWEGLVLSDCNKRMLYVPPGFAHGFLVLSDVADFIYRQTSYYSPEHERGVHWNDPAIGIKWPITPTDIAPRDDDHPLLKDACANFKYTNVG